MNKNLLKSLLVAGMLAVGVTQVSATIVDGVRQKPEPTNMGFVIDQESYLYNVGAKAFFTEGNSWGTQASIGSTGLVVYFSDAGNGAYLFNDYSLAKNAWKWVFFDSETAMFVDQNGQPNYFWDYKENSDGTFRLLPSSVNPNINSNIFPNLYVGLDVTENPDNTALSPLLAEGEGHYIDWALVSKEEYDAIIAIFNKAQELKTIIDKIKEIGGSVKIFEDVYLNEDATLDELNAALDEARTAYIQSVINNAEDQSNVDVTMMLVNPGYEQGETGWTVEAAKGSGPNGRAGNVRPGGTATNQCYEAWNNKEFDIYQEVPNAPAGVYQIEVQGFYRYGRGDNAWNAYLAQNVDFVKPSGVPVYVYLNNNATNFTNVYGDSQQITDETFYSAGSSDYASQTKDGITYYFPNGMASAAVAFSDGMYKQSAFGLVARDGDVMRIGVKGNSSQLNDSWVIWDNFKLIYRGFNPEVIKPVLEEAVKDIEDNYIGLLMGKTEYAAFTTALAAAEKAIADNDGEAMFNALNALYDAKDPALISKDIFLANDVKSEITRLENGIKEVEGKKMAKSTLAAANALLKGMNENTIYENEDAVIGEGTPSKIQEDVTAMIDALNSSVELYSQFNVAIGNLQTAINEVSGEGQHVSKDMIADANALKADSEKAYNDGSVDDADVPAAIKGIESAIENLTKSVELYKQLAESISSLEKAIEEAQKENTAEDLISKELLEDANKLVASASEEYAKSSLNNEGVEARLKDIEDMVKRLEAAIGSLYFTVYPLTYHITSIKNLTVEVFKCDQNFAGELEIPETVTNKGLTYTVTSIASTAFQHCVYITHVSIPRGIDHVGSGCFDDCPSLGGISYSGEGGSPYSGSAWVIDEDATSVSQGDFVIVWNDLTAVTLPASLKSIGEKCFYGCFRLMTVTSKITDLFSISDDTFADVTYMFAQLIVPDGTKALYESTPGWKNFKNIIEASTVGVDSQLINGQSVGDIYTLGGLKVQNAQKGLYIQNGKKVVKK